MVGGVIILTLLRRNEIRSCFLMIESPGRVSSSCLVLLFFPLIKVSKLDRMRDGVECEMGRDIYGIYWDVIRDNMGGDV